LIIADNDTDNNNFDGDFDTDEPDEKKMLLSQL